MKNNCTNLINFIYDSPSQFHVIKNIENILLESNYIQLQESEKWQFENQKKYFVKRNDGALIAFEIGDIQDNYSFKLIASHTDSPGFKIKYCPEIVAEKRYVKLNTEVYGGPILSTWFDRPLSMAGKVVLKSDNILKPCVKLVDFKKPILIIPNLAIHLNRDVNEGVKINKQKDTLPLLCFFEEQKHNNIEYMLDMIAKDLNINKDDILDFEITLYESEKGKIIGYNDEFISCSKLDDLWMVHASLEGFLKSKSEKGIKMCVFLNNEEVGSTSSEGAESDFLSYVIRRINLALKKEEEDYYIALSNSLMISADLAHATHPNYPDSHDPTNRPVLGKGPVIKYSANKKYSTTSDIAAIFSQICQNNNIPFQRFFNRSDLIGGSTMGPFFSKKLGIPVLDVGMPIFAMHSIRELCATQDVDYAIKMFEFFYNI